MALRRIPEETINQVRDLFSKGVPIREIVATTGVSGWPVYRYTRGLVANPFRNGKRTMPETIRNIRESYLAGMQFGEICRKLGVSKWQIQHYTTGLPRRNHIVTPQEIERIRTLFKEGSSIQEIAYDTKVGIPAICSATRDLKTPVRKFIKERTFEVLRSLTTDGYFITPKSAIKYSGCVRLLSRWLDIRKASVSTRIRGRVINVCFLPDRKEAAAKAVLGMLKNRSMSYHKLALITRVFGVKLPEKEKRELVA